MITWGNGRSTNLREIVSALVLLATACSERHSSSPLTVEIDADSALRSASTQVDALVERQDPNDSGWVLLSERRFEPRDEKSWPLTFELSDVVSGVYQVTALARDDRGAVIAQAKMTESISDDSGSAVLRVRFNDFAVPDDARDAGIDAATIEPASDPNADPECVRHGRGYAYCDGETMRACDAENHSRTRPCAEHERCVSVGDAPRCACSPGLVDTGAGCRPPDDPHP
jgi:hypothetical protein